MNSVEGNTLPEGWRQVKISDVSEFIRGITFKTSDAKNNYEDGLVGVYRTKNIQETLTLDDVYFLTKEHIRNNNKYLKKGDILISSANSLELLGKCCRYIQMDYPASLGGFISCARVNSLMNADFFYYFFASDFNQTKMRGLANKTTGIANLPLKSVSELPIPLPPLNEQKRIVAKIDTLFAKIDEAISLTEESLKQAKNLLPSVLNEVFDNCEGAIMKLSDVSVIQPKKNQVKDLECNVSFVPMKYLEENKIDFTPESDKNITDVYKGYTYFQDDDVLLAKVIPCFQNGKSGVAKRLTNGIGFGSSEFIVFRPKGFILSEWLYYNISSSDFLREGNKNMSGAVGLKRLIKSFVSDWEIKVPDLKRQKEFVDRITKISNHSKMTQTKLEEQLDYLKHLKSSVLSKAFKGEL